MKAAVNIARVIVGILFIFSGLIKANDPLGLSYKMQEFFEVWGVTGLNSYTLASSILMNAFEIIAGFALLIGWRINLFSWLLLLLILFFTFLTGYTFVTGKPTNCGCFGDCIPITAKTSFLKDVILTVLIGFIFWQRKKIRPLLSNKLSAIAMTLITIFSFGFQWYTLNYMPVLDCLPFKKNNNIADQMKVPKNAIFPVKAITFVYEKNGVQNEYTADKLPADLDSTYKLIRRYDKTVVEGKNYMAPIHGFELKGITDEDSTAIVLSQPYAVLLFYLGLPSSKESWMKDFSSLYSEARAKNIPTYAIVTRLNETRRSFESQPFKDIPVFSCDITAIRTAARTNPSVYLLEKGRVLDKQSGKRIDLILEKIKALPKQPDPPANNAIQPDSIQQ